MGIDVTSSSGKERKRPPVLSEASLRQLVKVALDKGYYTETFHAENEHPERQISLDDVLHGLEREDWTLTKTPNFDEEHWSWEYLISTTDIDGDALGIKLAAFPDDRRIEIITRW